MNSESSLSIKEYFTLDAWAALSDYEKRRYENVMKNYEFMKSNGVTAKMPEFMMNKFQRALSKRNKTNDGHTESSLDTKGKFKYFAVPKCKKYKKVVYSDTSATKEIESSSSKPIIKAEHNLGAESIHKRKEFAINIQSSAENILKIMKDLFGSRDDFKDAKDFFDEDITLLDPGSFKDIQQEPRYPKRSVAKKSYKEDSLYKDDEFLYCDICKKDHKGPCPVHGPMLLVCDKKIPKGDPDRARRTLPLFLSIGVSSLPGAGLGVWTEIPLVPGMVFGPYEGQIVKKDANFKDSGYAWKIRKGSKANRYVEAADKNYSNWLRYVNCANHEEWQNVVAFQYQGDIYYRTYKHVLPFTEILVWYGNDYGSELALQAKEVKCLLPSEDITGFSCDVCYSLFSSYESLQIHLKKHPRSQKEKRFQCPECPYSTYACSSISNHMLTHSGEQPYACPHCKKRFSRKGNLQKHVLLHKGGKPYGCNTCGKRFTEKGSLIKHGRLHSGEKPYRCPDCGKDFRESSNLKVHYLLHTRQMPFPCPHCERRFSSKGILDRHISSIHTKVFPHNCSMCGKGFSVPSRMRKHIEKHHNETGK